jgi:hypothetical protein
MNSTQWIIIASIIFSILLFDGILIGIYLSTKRKADQAGGWPTTTGTIKESRIETRYDSDSGSTDYPVITYTYRVMGTDYESQRVTPGPQWGGTGAHKVVACYPAGSQVQVYYNDQKPSEALLENKAPGWMNWLMIAAVGLDLFLFCIGAVLVVGMRSLE